MTLALPTLRLPALRLPVLRLPDARRMHRDRAPNPLRTAARLLAVGAATAFLALVVWSVGPGNLVDALVEEARRSASVFIALLGGVIGLALAASAIALLRGRPGWSMGIAVVPLVGLLVMLVS